MELVLALDAGTSGVRTVAFDRELRVVDESARELTQYFPSPGEVEHDPDEILTLAIETLRDVAVRARAAGHVVKALGITNQRETTVAFDRENGHALHRAIVWQDRRTLEYCRALAADGHEPAVRDVTGLVLDPYFSATKMRWLLDHGVTERARTPSLCTIDTWLLWVLSGGTEGGRYLTEASNASRTMLLDLTSREWSQEMTTLFDVDVAMLAEVRPSAGHFASVASSVVAELADVPVTGILGDQQSALFGQACFEPGLVKATYGTGAFVLVHASDTVPPAVDGLLTSVAWDLGNHGHAYAWEGSAFVAGAAVQWLRDLGIIEASNALEKWALSVESSGGVQFIPAFTGLGSPFWRADARGAITGLSASVGRGELARSLVEALAFEVRAITDAFRDAGLALKELRADGGAAVMDLLLSLQATNSRLVVRRSESVEATARGAASVAGLGAGLFGSLEDLATRWRGERRFDPENPSLIDANYLAWRRALERA